RDGGDDLKGRGRGGDGLQTHFLPCCWCRRRHPTPPGFLLILPFSLSAPVLFFHLWFPVFILSRFCPFSLCSCFSSSLDSSFYSVFCSLLSLFQAFSFSFPVLYS
ncbi:unnamed protein product, partial [Discosporangium mesarthrocarpum]